MQKLDYPRSIIEFQQWFPDEEACIKYLFRSRWPDGFVCPICGDREFYHISSRRVYQCKANKHQTYLTAGTVMHGTRTPLLTWFWAAYLLTTPTPGISAVQLQRQLQIDRYETAFNILHKLRASMVNPFRDKIGSTLELDETYVGGPTTGGKRGRGSQKAIVLIAVERKGKKAGRLRLRHVKDVTESTMISFVKNSVNEGATIISDSFKSYTNLNKQGYIHKPVVQKKVGVDASLPIAHLVASNLRFCQ